MPVIDLNSDLGEGNANDAELLAMITSCNIACGGHVGDSESMRVTIAAAIKNNVAIGAHPSYPDRQGFGRRNEYLGGEALRNCVLEQIDTLNALALQQGAILTHVKPHGALYNDAAGNAELANLVAVCVAESAPGAALVGLAGSEMQGAAGRNSLVFAAEGFVDRAYQQDGTLVPRCEPDAVHCSLDLILPQAVSLVGQVDTLCIHGDTPGAVETAAAVCAELGRQGVEIRALRRG